MDVSYLVSQDCGSWLSTSRCVDDDETRLELRATAPSRRAESGSNRHEV